MKEKISGFLYHHYWASVTVGLFTGFYKIKKCPICGHLFLGDNAICSHCGYEPLYHIGEDFDKLKEEWNKHD